MKSAAFALGVFAAVAAGQEIASCAQQCVDNMLAESKAEELGCGAEEWSCLCQNPDFAYGFRDCARAVCDTEQKASGAINYVLNLCSDKGIIITTGSNGDVTGSPTDGEPASSVVATVTSDGSVVTKPVPSRTPGASAPGGGAGGAVTTITSGDEVFTSTLSTPVSEVVTETSVVGSTSVVETETDTVTEGDENATETATDGASTETGAEDAGTIPTAAPGLLAAACFVAFML